MNWQAAKQKNGQGKNEADEKDVCNRKKSCKVKIYGF
jgi:hypothetical protein